MGWMDEYELALKQQLTGNTTSSGGGGSSGGSSGGDSSASGLARQLQKKSNSTRKSNNARKAFNSWLEEYNRALLELQAKNSFNVSSGKYVATPEEIVKGTRTNNDEDEERTWFQKGLFEDGYDRWDVAKTILGTVGDVSQDALAGILGMGEKAADALAYLAPYLIRGTQTASFNPEVNQAYDDMFNEAKGWAQKFIPRDLYDEEAVAASIVGNNVEDLTGFNVENASVLGAKSDALVQSAGQQAGQYGLSLIGVPWFVTSGVTTFGSEAENALNEGASYGAAGASAAISAGAEILSEKLSGGDIFTSSSGSDLATTFLTRSIADKGLRTFAKLGIDGLGEGAEEIFSQFFSNLGSALYREEDLGEILFSEQAMDEYLESFIGGWVLGEAMGGINVYKSGKAGRDFTSGMTDSEKSVVDKLFQDRLAEAEKDGGKLSAWKKNKLYESVIRDMDRGYISTDTIEEVLAGESYKAYKDTFDTEDAKIKDLQKQIAELENSPNTVGNNRKYDELTSQIAELKKNAQSNQLRAKLDSEIFGIVKGTRLAESYNERSRRGEAFQADLTKYNPKQRAIVQRAIDSGILNNSNRTHDFVNVVARISADKGVLFDFTNNDKLKESGFAIDGATVDGYVTESGISINIDSPKAWQSTVGHEITHVLEGTDLYTELQQMLFSYADSKGVLGNRRSSIQSRYKNIKGANFDAELTADLVGEYLFTDEDFVKNLSANHRNIFQKIYDEIKYLGRIVTAGSKQARDLERVKRAFDKAYREGGKAHGETKYSLTDSSNAPKNSGIYSTPASDLRLDKPNTAPATDADLIPYTEYIPETDADKIPYTEHLRTGDGIAPVARARDEAKTPGGDGVNSAQTDSRNGTRKDLHRSIIDGIKTSFKARGLDFDAVLKNAKKLSTWSTVDNTPQRVMEKALGYKEGGILADITVNRVAQNESRGIRWLNSFTDRKNGVLAQISKQYHIKPGSKKSAAAQMYAEGFFVDENNNIVKYGDRELAIDFPNPKDQANIKGLARDPRIRRIYDETLAMINASRARNLYPEIPRLDNYFLHFRAMQDTFSTLGLPFNPNDIRAKDLPTDLNGVTADLKPGQPFFASAMHRTGKRTSFDLLGGLERYLSSAKNQIYHIDDIQTLRALRNYIAETYGQATGLEDLDTLTDTAAKEKIEQVYGAHLSNFARFLNEEANILAGKTPLIDRGAEGVFGRRAMTFMKTLSSQVGSHQVGYNVSPAFTNFMPVAQTFANTNKFDFVKAFAQTVANKFSGGRFDAFTNDSPVVIRRRGIDTFYQTPWQKMQNHGYALMSAVDDISTELIARTKYNEFTRKGMDSQQAHYETDKWVSRLMGDRSLGQQPLLYNSQVLGLFTKYQLEVRNYLDSAFYDTVQEVKASNEDIQNGLARNAKNAADITSRFISTAVVMHLFGEAFESVAGYNPAFDIVEALMTAFGYDDEEDSEDTVLDNLGQALLELAEDMPYSSLFLEGGRIPIPIADALPDIPAILHGEDEYGNDIGFFRALWEEAKDIAPYYLLPGGYGQFKKTKAGLEMFSDEHPIAGSYTEAGNLRFPVEDTFANRLKAAIFGQYANDNARTYFDEERRTLNPDQTAIVAGLGIPIEEYWDHLDNLYAFYDEKDRLKEAAEAEDATAEDVLRSRYASSIYSEIYDLYDKQREIANGNSPTKQAELREIQRQIADLINQSKNGMNDIFVSGAYAEIGGRRFNQDAESGQWYEITPTKANGKPNYYYEQEQKITQGFGISYEEYWNNRDAYDDAYWFATSYGKNLLNTAKYVFGGADFARYAGGLSELKADKDENGKSINGSKKAKVLAYCNLMNADYGQRIILFKSQYPSDDTYNYEIIDYLNGRSDISYDEMKAILIELGFEVDGEGNITW